MFGLGSGVVRQCKRAATHAVTSGEPVLFCSSHVAEERELARVRKAAAGSVELAPLDEHPPETPPLPSPEPMRPMLLAYGTTGTHADPSGDPEGAWAHRMSLRVFARPPLGEAVALVRLSDRERTAFTVAASTLGMERHELMRALLFLGVATLPQLATLLEVHPSLEAEIRATMPVPRHASIPEWAAAVRAVGLR